MITLLLALSAHASTLQVPGDYLTLSAAVDAASPGDTIELGPTYVAQEEIDLGGVVIPAGRDLRIRGVGGVTPVLPPIDAYADLELRDVSIAGAWAIDEAMPFVVRIHGVALDAREVHVLGPAPAFWGQDATLSFEGLSASDVVAKGPVIFASGGSLALSQAQLTGNAGGAVVAMHADVTVLQSMFSANTAQQGADIRWTTDGAHHLLVGNASLSGGVATTGGSIHATGGTVHLKDLEITGSSATEGGGALALTGTSALIERVTFTDTKGPWGAVLLLDEGEATVTESVVDGFTSTHGAFVVGDGAAATLTLDQLLLDGKSGADTSGRAVVAHPGAGIVVRASAIGGVSASSGAALSAEHATIELDNVTITGTVSTGAGAVHLVHSDAVIRHSRLNHNQGAVGAAIWADGGTLLVEDSHLEGNVADDATIFADRAQVTVRRTRLCANDDDQSGALRLFAGGDEPHLVEHSTFLFQSSGTDGGAIRFDGDNASSLQVRNNTFVGNRRAALVLMGATADVRNNILVGHPAAVILDSVTGLSGGYNLWFDNDIGQLGGPSEALDAYAVTADPRFEALTDGDCGSSVALLPDSPALDAGDPSLLDEDGSPSDIGADGPVPPEEEEPVDPALCDVDGDGYLSEACGGDDCDDADASVHPGAEDPPDDGVDRNCDGIDGTTWLFGGGGCSTTPAGGSGALALLALLLLGRRRGRAHRS